MQPEMTNQGNLRTATSRFKDEVEAFCRWSVKVEAEAEAAVSREALAELQTSLERKWDKFQEKWQEFLRTYPEPERHLDAAGNEIEDEAQLEEVRGAFTIRTTYLINAEVAQNQLESVIRAKYTEITIAAKPGGVEAERHRVRAAETISSTSYEVAKAKWREEQAKVQPMIDKLKAELEVAPVTQDLAKAKKFKRYAVDIEKAKDQMDRLTDQMQKLNPAQAEVLKADHIAEMLRIETEYADYGRRVEEFHISCLEKRDEMDDRSVTLRATSTPEREGSSLSRGGSSSDKGLSLEKLKCEMFSGKMQHYPRWKQVWQDMMHPRMNYKDELVLLSRNVPADARSELERLTTLDACWEFLDAEYGNKLKMVAQRVKDLNGFKFSSQAKSEEAKTRELHRIWRDVYNDLKSVGYEEDLNPGSVIQGFVSKFPSKLKDKWQDFYEKPEYIAEPPGKVLNQFIIWARDRAQKMDVWEAEVGGNTSSVGSGTTNCSECGGSHTLGSRRECYKEEEGLKRGCWA